MCPLQAGPLCAGSDHVCDGLGSVCTDNTEDQGCPGTFNCISSPWKVVNRLEICNGYPNCADHSDEKEACDSTFQCNTGQWISGHSVCDGNNNCGNWVDEMYCDVSMGFSCVNTTEVLSCFAHVVRGSPYGRANMRGATCPMSCYSFLLLVLAY
eukprot:sb/3473298/